MRTRLGMAGVAVFVGLVAVAGLSAQNAPAAKAAPAPPTPSSCGPKPPDSLKNVAKGSRCFELRIYTLKSEGQGDADLLHKRFREKTNPLFKKHGFTIIGYWQPVSKPDTLIYMLAFKDAATRDADWNAFNTDPDWIKARADMNVAVTVANEFMIATDYSPMK